MSFPTVTITLKELTDIRDSLGVLLGAKIPIRASYRAAKFCKKVVAEIEALDKSRKDLIIKHGTKLEDGLNYRVEPANADAWKKELDTLLEEKVELPVMKLTLDEIKDAPLSMLDVANLEFLIDEPAAEQADTTQ